MVFGRGRSMTAVMKIVVAEEVHAEAICDIVRRSILQLCREDHRGDPEVLQRWLSGKTPESVRGWILDPANYMVIAVRGEEPVGAGCINANGEVTLNYVLPEARFCGVSSAIISALEAHARTAGHRRVALDSTTTARSFYEDRGYRSRGPHGSKFGLATWPMMKSL